MRNRIEITAATVWDDHQIARWASLDGSAGQITTVFGSRQEQLVGHGRAPNDVPKISSTRIEQHAAHARRVGLKFFYLLNGRCAHLQFEEPRTYGQIISDLDWVVNSVRATGVVVADLRLARLIRSQYPRETLDIRVSTIAGVKTPKALQPWLALDIDGVVLHHDVARDFRALKHLTDYLAQHAPHVHIELLLNESCLHGCASRGAHYERLAAAPVGYVEGFQQNCNLPKFRDPSLLLSANWIRPEDTKYYNEEFGICRFKIAGREMPAQWLDRVVSAYANGEYNGNLVDLLTITPPGLNMTAAEVLFVDNPALSGFLQDLVSWKGTPRAFYSHLASKLWQESCLRVSDPGGLYGLVDGKPVCAQPGQHQKSLCSLQAFADPAYRATKAGRF